jgi:hypothetical protein
MVSSEQAQAFELVIQPHVEPVARPWQRCRRHAEAVDQRIAHQPARPRPRSAHLDRGQPLRDRPLPRRHTSAAGRRRTGQQANRQQGRSSRIM